MPQLKETIKVKIGNIDYEKKQIAFYTKWAISALILKSTTKNC
jgi:hypothetical protein